MWDLQGDREDHSGLVLIAFITDRTELSGDLAFHCEAHPSNSGTTITTSISKASKGCLSFDTQLVRVSLPVAPDFFCSSRAEGFAVQDHVWHPPRRAALANCSLIVLVPEFCKWQILETLGTSLHTVTKPTSDFSCAPSPRCACKTLWMEPFRNSWEHQALTKAGRPLVSASGEFQPGFLRTGDSCGHQKGKALGGKPGVHEGIRCREGRPGLWDQVSQVQLYGHSLRWVEPWAGEQEQPAPWSSHSSVFSYGCWWGAWMVARVAGCSDSGGYPRWCFGGEE